MSKNTVNRNTDNSFYKFKLINYNQWYELSSFCAFKYPHYREVVADYFLFIDDALEWDRLEDLTSEEDVIYSSSRV